jgi:deoxyribose-phosphate aldolase
MKKLDYKTIAKMIDHSLLHPTLSEKELTEGCAIAREYNVASVCVKPYHVSLAKRELEGSEVLVCAVIGFPHGNSTIAIKLAETLQVIQDGATEVDMVVNLSKVKEEDWDFLEKEISTITSVCHQNNAIIKVIFEVDYLNDNQIIRLCEICSQVKADFVKTSTGYNYNKTEDGKYDYKGATEHVLSLMRKHSLPHVQVKAAGRVVGLDGFLKVWNLGITRVGTGQTVSIMEEAKKYFAKNEM